MFVMYKLIHLIAALFDFTASFMEIEIKYRKSENKKSALADLPAVRRAHFRSPKETVMYLARSVLSRSLQRSLAVRSFCGTIPTSVKIDHSQPAAKKDGAKASTDKCGPVPQEGDDDDLDEWEEMFVQGPAGLEWNGPTRGGRRPEPTRFGDWERKGRASDF